MNTSMNSTTAATTAGTVTVSQMSESEIVITLSPSEQHPGKVTVKVSNRGNGDEAKLIWIK